MEPIYYNYNQTIYAKEGETLHCLKRRNSENNLENIKMMPIFSLWFARLNITMSELVVEVSELKAVNPV